MSSGDGRLPALVSDQHRQTKEATMVPNEHLDDLERAVGQLRERVTTLAVENQTGRATASIEYLVRLQAAVEAIGRTIEDARWARQGPYEFQGE
jgi:hypothetical protein